METTLIIGVIKNVLWSLRNVNSSGAPKLIPFSFGDVLGETKSHRKEKGKRQK